VGIGAGIANGQADLTYEQYTPGTQNSVYGAAEQACAIERWFEAGEPLADDPATFQENLADIQSVGADTLPGNPVDLAAAYNADYCKRRHPVSPGMALAPFHVAPEFGVRVAKRVVLSVYARLQVVSGSKVYSDNPDLELGESFNRDVRSPAPSGTRNKPPFSWAIGAKAKYFFLPDDRKFRLFAGGFAGYGTAQLRVPMGFSNDRNGNSVPDAVEVALHGTQDVNNEIIPETCVPVWPYNAGCVPPEDGTEGDADRTLARQVLMSTPSSDQRIDTVRIGPGFVGVLFGFHYQIVNHFAVFAELDVGGWFPNTSSVLFDLTLGPAITF
jgi:hypothetical protein